MDYKPIIVGLAVVALLVKGGMDMYYNYAGMASPDAAGVAASDAAVAASNAARWSFWSGLGLFAVGAALGWVEWSLLTSKEGGLYD